MINIKIKTLLLVFLQIIFYFKNQTNQQISEFCKKNYGVTFPIMSKIDVKGKNIHPIYRFLTDKSKNGYIDSKVTWNFQKIFN